MTTELFDSQSLPEINFRYLSEEDMIKAGVKDMGACIDAMEETLKLLAQGDYRMAGANADSHGAMVTFPENPEFPGMPADGPDRRFMAMPAYLGGSFQTTGVKWYGSNTENRAKGLPRSILMLTLNDTATGAPLAHMSANILSAYRTGAIPGVAARYYAPENATTVGILGPGVMAKTSLAAFISARPSITTIKLKGRSPKSTDSFISWAAKEYPQVSIELVDSIEDVVRGSDIITFCTSSEVGDVSTYPTVERSWVKPGALLTMPAACNVDDAMLGDDVRKIVDNSGLYEAWAEETGREISHEVIPVIGCKFVDLIKQGKLGKEQVEDLGDLLNQQKLDKDPEHITLFSVGGMPIEDVAWGTVILRRAIEQNIGTVLNLWKTPELA